MSTAQHNDITALRAALFEALRGVKTGTLELDKARAINELSKTLVDTARVEVAYLEATGNSRSTFLEAKPGEEQMPAGVLSITRHHLR